jgi:hypothetical protein
MPLRKNTGNSNPPIINIWVAGIVGILAIIAGAALLKVSWAVAGACVSAGIGIIFLGIGNETTAIPRISLCLFAVALILLGIALSQLFHI